MATKKSQDVTTSQPEDVTTSHVKPTTQRLTVLQAVASVVAVKPGAFLKRPKSHQEVKRATPEETVAALHLPPSTKTADG